MAHGARQMDLLIAGMPSIDLDDWQTNTVYMGFFSKDSPEVQWFWEIVHDEFGATEHAKLMHFTTGSASVPASGFSTLSGYGGGTCRFTLEGRTDQGPEHLPTAATCFNRLRMPRYTSKEQMALRLKTAIMGVQQFHEVLLPVAAHTSPSAHAIAPPQLREYSHSRAASVFWPSGSDGRAKCGGRRGGSGSDGRWGHRPLSAAVVANTVPRSDGEAPDRPPCTCCASCARVANCGVCFDKDCLKRNDKNTCTYLLWHSYYHIQSGPELG